MKLPDHPPTVTRCRERLALLIAEPGEGKAPGAGA